MFILRFLSMTVSIIFGFALLSSACQNSHGTTAAEVDTRALEESKALDVARQSLASRSFALLKGTTTVELWNRVRFEVDLRVAGESFAIEYLTEENRLDIGEIPPPAPGSRLHVLAAQAMSTPDSRPEKIFLLILDARRYVYQYNPTSKARADVTLAEVSERFRRDLADFLSWYEGEKSKKKEP
jgi:hypothetical protein